MPVMNGEICVRCGACVAVCPQRVLSPTQGGPPERSPDWEQHCLRCGHCAAVCYGQALTVEVGGTAGRKAVSPPPPADEVLAWLRARRSVRRYQHRGVARDRIVELLEAARCSPTGHNGQQVGCAVVATEGHRNRLTEQICGVYRRLGWGLGNPIVRVAVSLWVGRDRAKELWNALPGLRRAQEQIKAGRDPLFHHAPVILLVHAPPGETAEADCALAAGQLSLLAPSLGLGTCHIGYASAVLKRLPRLALPCGVPRRRRTFAVLTLGYPDVRYHWVPPRLPFPATWR